jgi:hypothetical protein
MNRLIRRAVHGPAENEAIGSSPADETCMPRADRLGKRAARLSDFASGWQRVAPRIGAT